MTLEGLVARELALLLRFLARSRAGPLDREVPLTMLHAGARVVEGPETVVNAAVQILFRILGALGRARLGRHCFRIIVGNGRRRRGFQLLEIAGFGHGGDLVYREFADDGAGARLTLSCTLLRARLESVSTTGDALPSKGAAKGAFGTVDASMLDTTA